MKKKILEYSAMVIGIMLGICLVSFALSGVYLTIDYVNRGIDFGTALEWSAEDMRDILGIKETEDLGIIEYPMANQHIEWSH